MKMAKEIRVERLSLNSVKVFIDGEEFPYAFVSAATRVAWQDGPSVVLELIADSIVFVDQIKRGSSADEPLG